MNDSGLLAEFCLQDVNTVDGDDRDNTQTYAAEVAQLGFDHRATNTRGKRLRPEPYRVVVENELASVAPDATTALGLGTTW